VAPKIKVSTTEEVQHRVSIKKRKPKKKQVKTPANLCLNQTMGIRFNAACFMMEEILDKNLKTIT
jgi:hypothetical protein